MIEIRLTVDIPGLPEALNNLANAIMMKNAVPAVEAPKRKSESKRTSETVAKNDTAQKSTEAPQTVPSESHTNTPATETNAPTAAPEAPVMEQNANNVPNDIPAVTISEISRAGAALVDAGMITELRELLKKFNAASIMALKSEQLADFAAGLRKLGAKI